MLSAPTTAVSTVHAAAATVTVGRAGVAKTALSADAPATAVGTGRAKQGCASAGHPSRAWLAKERRVRKTAAAMESVMI